METQTVLDDARITTFGRLVEAYALLTKTLDNEMEAAVGIPLLWYGVLLHLGRSPGGFRPISELVAATAFTSGGVTRLVDRIEQAGHVERRSCPSDRRVIYVGLTERGRELLERASVAHIRGIQEHLVNLVGATDFERLDAILAKVAPRGAADGS